MSRRNARKYAFELLYQVPFHTELNTEEAIAFYFSNLPDISREDRAFAEQEYLQTIRHLETIDQKLAAFCEGWRLERISRVDLAILRLAVFEMDYVPDIPSGVSISEAVEIAKEYGADPSPSFVNGILGKLAGLVEAAHG
jgi:N utilization substance protein B